MLRGKVAVVTGAVGGIGKAITEILLHNGAKVAMLDLNTTAGTGLKTTLDKEFGQQKTLFLRCNVESDKDVRDAFHTTVETFGGINIVCNNAGFMNETEWEKSLSINLAGVIRVSYVALEHMNKLTGGQGGTIINTASIAGLQPGPIFPAYSATKHGVVGFTRSMAAASDASGYGVCFNALCPAGVQTDFVTDVKSKIGQFSHLSYMAEKSIKEGLLDVSQVAECALELAVNEKMNGEALILQNEGKKYMTFPIL